MEDQVPLSSVNVEAPEGQQGQQQPEAKPDVPAGQQPAVVEKPAEPANPIGRLLADPAIRQLMETELDLPTDWTPETIAALPVAERMRVVSVLRQVSATQDGIRAQQAEAERAKQEAVAARQRVLTDRANVVKLSEGSKVRAHLEALKREAAGDGRPADPDSEEGMRRSLAAAQLERDQRLFSALEEDARSAQADAERQTRQAQIQAVIEANMSDFEEDSPGFDDEGKPMPFPAVVKMLHGEGLPFEKAYARAKAFRKAYAPAEAPADSSSIRPSSHNQGRPVAPPANLTGDDLTQWWVDHPDELAAFNKAKYGSR